VPPRPTLITGAAGFAGGHLIERLADEPLIGWHRPGSPAPAQSPNVSWRAVDIRVGASVADAIAANPPARVYHLAGIPHVGSAWADVVPSLETNVMGTHHLLEAVRRAGLPCRVLVVSSAMVYAPSASPIDETMPLRPTMPYGLSKLAQEQLALRAHDEDALEVIVARPFNHVGPRQDPGFAVSSFARQIAMIEARRAEPVIRVGNLDTRRDITDVRDVADAYARLMEAGVTGRAYNICSGHAVRIGDILEKLRGLSTASVRVEIDPTLLRPADPPVFVGNGSRIREEVGWVRRRSLDETLRDTLDAWRREFADTFA
jgi:GDP-4-dehydro-6-deoxy-D-mannose reductase